MLARTVLTNKGNSFQLTSLAIQLANVTQFVDSQVGTRIIELHNTLLHLNIAPPLMSRKGALNTPVSRWWMFWQGKGLSVWACARTL